VRVSKSIPRRGFKRFLMPPSYSSDKKTTSAKKIKRLSNFGSTADGNDKGTEKGDSQVLEFTYVSWWVAS
jgi:hypothetical protein|tara:strand:+ start:298 stop:507 length:210 start_codon:yes stop_codon:yes gene_type:complete